MPRSIAKPGPCIDSVPTAGICAPATCTLAYGLRLQDQQAFVRQIAGINMDTPDNGMELGYRAGVVGCPVRDQQWRRPAAPKSDNGKQYTAQVVRIKDRWRIGVGGNYNDNSAQRSAAACLFGGLRTGPVSWLAEVDAVNVQPDGQVRAASGGRAPGSRLAGAARRESEIHRRSARSGSQPQRQSADPLQRRRANTRRCSTCSCDWAGAGMDDHSDHYQAVNQAFLEVHAYF